MTLKANCFPQPQATEARLERCLSLIQQGSGIALIHCKGRKLKMSFFLVLHSCFSNRMKAMEPFSRSAQPSCSLSCFLLPESHHSRNREKEQRIILDENGELNTTMAHFVCFHSHLRNFCIVR